MKLTKQQIEQIKQSQKTTRQIAAEYGCAQSTIVRIRNRTETADDTLTREIVIEIATSNLTQIELSQRYGMPQQTISIIKRIGRLFV